MDCDRVPGTGSRPIGRDGAGKRRGRSTDGGEVEVAREQEAPTNGDGDETTNGRRR